MVYQTHRETQLRLIHITTYHFRCVFDKQCLFYQWKHKCWFIGQNTWSFLLQLTPSQFPLIIQKLSMMISTIAPLNSHKNIKTQNMMISTNAPLNSLHLRIWKARSRYGYDPVYALSTKVIINV